MNLRAHPERIFLLKYLAIGMICCAFAVYAAYDGFLAYPAELPRAHAWQKLQAEIEADSTLDRTDLVAQWKTLAKENDWSAKQIRKDDTVSAIQNKIYWQYAFIVIGLSIGLPCVIWYLTSRNSWIESTEDGLRSSNGTELLLDQIYRFDKKKWEKKGIGVVHFKNQVPNGEGTFILDDLKFDRKITDEIVRWVESKIPQEMIVNGKPENLKTETSTENSSDAGDPEANS
ncbi:hypothetical protein N9B60_02695 [Mariniblastus sp.]|nr:hypothetical protein [Mariniblastus sp.]MDA7928777.1 hypothetical protein [Mariniblastus sp.]MDB4379972.1 hypothetical protein [Mariniblastus sp.]